MIASQCGPTAVTIGHAVTIRQKDKALHVHSSLVRQIYRIRVSDGLWIDKATHSLLNGVDSTLFTEHAMQTLQ
jgi:hypothetical protein